MRRLVVLLAATTYVAVPPVVPLLPGFTVIQPALLTVLQAHPLVVVTVVLSVPPVAERLSDVGDTLKLHAAPC